MGAAAEYEIKNDNISKVKDFFNCYNVGARPFLKWAGGKGQLLGKFEELYPRELKQKKIKTFYEPFLGGGAVFFHIVQRYTIENAYLYDINDELILTYKAIQKDVTKLLDFLYRYEKKYIKLNKKQRQEFFYDQRTNYNQQRLNFNYDKYSERWFPRAAQLIFLNRTCFNGLYRVNSKGGFNSPVGDYDNPTICDEQNLLAVHQVLQIAEIKKADFKEIVTGMKAKSFVYFDPPFRPISKTASFKAYSKHIFADNQQVQLAKLFKQLDKKGIKVMLSNSDPKNNNPSDNFFDDMYSDYNITRVPAKRMINSDSTKRGAINEIVVTNYSVNNLDYIPSNEFNRKLFYSDKPYWTIREKMPINEIKVDSRKFLYNNDINLATVKVIQKQFDVDAWLPITIDTEGYLIDGQHRLLAAKNMNLEYIDVAVQNTKLLITK